MTQHQFDSHIPVPPAPRGGRGNSHPLAFMPVSNSKFFACERFDGVTDEEHQKQRTRMRSNLQNRCTDLKKKTGATFTIRALTEGGIEGFRVWRIS